MEPSCVTSSQVALEAAEKSAGYAFANTPYTPHGPIDRCERSLHHTNRSQYNRDEDHHEQWFVTSNPHLRECFTEFLGTFVMLCFGMGSTPKGVYVSEGVSGAHMNCAVTFAHAVYGRLPWRKVPGYCASQLFGAFLGACSVYVLNYQKLMKADPNKETMMVHFATYPNPDISNFTAFFTETLATTMLLLCFYAITDQRNRSLGPVGTPFAFALMIMVLGMGFGMNTGYAMNPARDSVLRLFTYIVGYGSKVFTLDGYYFLIPIFGTLCGGVIGAGIYTFLMQVQHPNELRDF